MNLSSAPRILVIVVTWNQKQYVINLLDSLQQLRYPHEQFDIVVVDNASKDGTQTAIRAAYPHVTLLTNAENLGGTGGFNTGLTWAYAQPTGKYTYFWLLDNDVVVHQDALQALVDILEAHADIAVAGSTMMQLDYPWRVNEMGCFFNWQTGGLVLHRHQEEVNTWRGKRIDDLRYSIVNLAAQLPGCSDYLDVDYVAAASLLIRAEVAKEVGIWRDYFIHYDDVEWCLRLAARGYRIVASARSVMWHISAAGKVPSWVLYYDSRNVLDCIQVHSPNQPAALHSVRRRIKRDAMRYALVGKIELAQLHLDALADFQAHRMGKKDIQLPYPAHPNQQLSVLLKEPSIKRVLIASDVNLIRTGLQESLVKLQIQRPDLHIDILHFGGERRYQLPRAQFVHLPRHLFKRLWTYWQLRGHYDVIIQSDYAMRVGLAWLSDKVIFINNEHFSSRPVLRWQAFWQFCWDWFKA